MPKWCSCFRGDKDSRKKQKPINKHDDDKYENFDLFLTGDNESGKTKIIKEFVSSHDAFTLKEKVLKTSEIECYIRDALTNIVLAFHQSDSHVQLAHPENRECVTYILKIANENDFDYPIEFFDHVEILWADAGLQEFLQRSDKYRLPDSAKYFLDRVRIIRDPDYIPSTEDMIYSRLLPSQIFKMSFHFDAEQTRFNVLETDFTRQEQQKLIQSFPDTAKAIIFVTDCSCFNIMVDENPGKTQLHQSLDLFKTIRDSKYLEGIVIILMLNKQDILTEKIKNGVRLEDYFPDFATDVIVDDNSSNFTPDEDPEVARAKYFIRNQFMKIDPECSPHFTTDSTIMIPLIFAGCRNLHQ